LQFAIIFGTGFYDFFKSHRIESIVTPFGEVQVYFSQVCGVEVLLLPRHGLSGLVAPHSINYKANIWALHNLGVKNIIAVAAVGSMNKDMPPSMLVIPEQIIDYTFDRRHTFFSSSKPEYIDFSKPYKQDLRQIIIDSLIATNITHVVGGTYGVTQGPRLETIAEIKRMQQDGCDLVGMTAMPEASLAAEKRINYASICVVANWAAGVTDDYINMDDINENLSKGMKNVYMNFDNLLS